jgi:hypothetical protein
MHDMSRGDVTVEHTAAFAAVHALREGLRLDRPALRARLRRATWIDSDDFGTGSCSLVPQYRNQLSPRGIKNMLGEHTARQTLNVQVFNADAGKSAADIGRELVQKIVSPASNFPRVGRKSGLSFRAAAGSSFASSQNSLSAPQALAARLIQLGRAIVSPFDNAISEDRPKSILTVSPCRGSTSATSTWKTTNHLPFCRVRIAEDGLLGRARCHLHLDLVRDADDAEVPILPQRQPISDTELGGVIASRGTKPRKAWFFDGRELGDG